MSFIKSLDRYRSESNVEAEMKNTRGHMVCDVIALDEADKMASDSKTIEEVFLTGSDTSTGPVEIDVGRLQGEFVQVRVKAESGAGWNVRFAGEAQPSEIGVTLDGVTTETLLHLMWQCPNLRFLALENMVTLPSAIYNPQLLSLRIAGTSTEHIPEGIENSQDLTWLAVTGTSCRSLPEGISHLMNLKEMDLSGNKLESCPPLLAVKMVDLSRNRLRTIPDWICDVIPHGRFSDPRMMLNLQGNPIAYGAGVLHPATRLKADRRTQPNEVRDTVVRGRDLEGGRVIDLSHNCISALPPWMREASLLTVLNIDRSDTLFSDETTGLVFGLRDL